MQASPRSALRSLAAIGGLILLLTAGADANPTPPHYAITDLGTLGGTDSLGVSVNEAGQVVGSASLSDGSTHAFLWAVGKIQDLGPSGSNPSQALAINNRGVIVGWASDSSGAQKPALWTEGLFQDLSPGGPWGVVGSVNDLDQIAGHLNGTGTIWTDGVPQTVFPGPVSVINNAGNWSAYTDAAAYLKDGTLLASVAYTTAMNEKGEVVGYFRASPGASAALWTGGQTVRLGTLGGMESRAWDINDAGQIAGQAQTGSGAWHAYLYTSGEGIVDLNTRTDPGLGWELQNARGINAAGQITGTGTVNGQSHAFLLTPLPSAGTGAWAQADRSSAAFGTVVIGASGAVKSVRLTNTGDAPLTIGTISIAGGDPGDFAVSGGAGVTVPPGGSTLLTITFSPAAAGPRSAYLAIASNAYYGPTTITLVGAGKAGIPPAPRYTITDLGTLGGTDSVGSGINDVGQVVGNATFPDGSRHAFLWTAGKMQDLGTLGGNQSGAIRINNHGVIAGLAHTATDVRKPVIWTNGVIQDLSPGGDWGVAYGINDAGQVTGHIGGQGMLWTDGLGQPLPFTVGGALNDAGQVSGYTDAAAFLWTNGTPQPIFTYAYTTAINDAGQVVGYYRASPGHLAALWNGSQAVILGTLGGNESYAWDINAAGQIVGHAQTAAGTWHAFLYNSGGGMVDLNSCIDAGLGWELQDAHGINATGQIAGQGTIQGQGHAFLLTPLPSQPSGHVQVDASALDFGSVILNSASAAQSVKVTNGGNAPLSINTVSLAGANPGDFAVSGGTGVIVPPNGTALLTVTFTPTAVGARDANLAITSNADNGPTTVALTGNGTPPSNAHSQVDASALDFGTVTLNATSAAQSVKLTNTGSAPLTISSTSLTGANAGDFAVSGGTGVTVPAGGNTSLSVTFTPAAAGSRSASLVIASDASNSPTTVTVTGAGKLAPAPVAVPAASLNATSLTFGDQLVDTTTVEQTVTLTNTGGAPLTVGTLSLSGSNPDDFIAAADPGGLALAAGESRAIRVRFRPTAPGSRSATLAITDSAADSPQRVTLAGNGTMPSITFGISRLSGPGTISFGSVALGTSGAAQTLTLTNSGTAPLTISSVALTGDAAGDYRITADSGGATLPPGGSRTLTVGFTPMALGSRRAALKISDNADGGQQTIVLDGMGTLSTSSSQGRAVIPTKVVLVLDSIDGNAVQSQVLGPNKVVGISTGQQVTLKLLAKFSNGAVADVTGDRNSHIGVGAPVGLFTARNAWTARPADAGRLVTFYAGYRSAVTRNRLVATLLLSVHRNRRRP